MWESRAPQPAASSHHRELPPLAAGEQLPGVKADSMGCGMGVGSAAPSARLLQHCTSSVCNPEGAKSSAKGCRCHSGGKRLRDEVVLRWGRTWRSTWNYAHRRMECLTSLDLLQDQINLLYVLTLYSLLQARKWRHQENRLPGGCSICPSATPSVSSPRRKLKVSAVDEVGFGSLQRGHQPLPHAQSKPQPGSFLELSPYSMENGKQHCWGCTPQGSLLCLGFVATTRLLDSCHASLQPLGFLLKALWNCTRLGMQLLCLLGLKSSFQTKLQAFLWNIEDTLRPRGWVMIYNKHSSDLQPLFLY